jgi:hypothetical protein
LCHFANWHNAPVFAEEAGYDKTIEEDNPMTTETQKLRGLTAARLASLSAPVLVVGIWVALAVSVPTAPHVTPSATQATPVKVTGGTPTQAEADWMTWSAATSCAGCN